MLPGVFVLCCLLREDEARQRVESAESLSDEVHRGEKWGLQSWQIRLNFDVPVGQSVRGEAGWRLRVEKKDDDRGYLLYACMGGQKNKHVILPRRVQISIQHTASPDLQPCLLTHHE